MERLLLIIITIVITLFTLKLYGFWNQIKRKEKQDKALSILKLHGLEPELYLATIGIDDDDLCSALEEFEFTGHIIKDKDGEVIGGLVPKMKKQPNLRLVISND